MTARLMLLAAAVIGLATARLLFVFRNPFDDADDDKLIVVGIVASLALTVGSCFVPPTGDRSL